ncbi:conserved hypothetical protein [Desulfamplus magnetovallimortis]|uniref:Ribosome association toxin RatA n=1 Tax=Desulfamplus magnetovallimortis TaxID=1246637 RepID=A0A1W1H583_9BACT|nr:SRPBCC family protein [Desulfamplus magnetovallimortis]SLM27639.1 conserved hypothetical protein [Desulfamplus magnetovallimortis]
MIHRIQRHITVPSSMEKVWDFISNPENLNKITPENLHFQILTPLPPKMYNGLLIEYNVTIPIFGKTQWLTEIKHIRPHVSFVDEQRAGPYTLWYHYHEIQNCNRGVLIKDDVTYRAPFGILGNVVNALFIEKMLNQIFDYREKKFLELL